MSKIIEKLQDALVELKYKPVEIMYYSNGFENHMKGKLIEYDYYEHNGNLFITIVLMNGTDNIIDNDISMNSRNEIKYGIDNFMNKQINFTGKGIEIANKLIADSKMYIKLI